MTQSSRLSTDPIPMEFEINNEGEKYKPLSFTIKLKIFLTNITVEPMLAIYILAQTISLLAVNNLILEKGCRVNLNFEKDICDALSVRNESYPGYKEYEEKVQVLAAGMFIWRDICICIMPAILLLFIGSWSDRHKKRKHIILNCILGTATTFTCFLICTYFFYDLPLEVNILGEVLPTIITGGFPVASVGVFSYISNISSENTRTIRIGAAQVSVISFMIIGNLLSGISFEKMHFYGVFGLTLVLLLAAYLYGQCFVTDIWKYEVKKGVVFEKTEKCFLMDLFDVTHVKETFKVAFQTRENNGRKKIWLLFLLTLLLIGPHRGETNMVFYYMKLKFGWSPVEFSWFFTFRNLSFMVGNLVGLVVFSKIFKFNDYFLGVISCISQILANLLYALGPTSTYIFLGITMDLFGYFHHTIIRSIGSKLVHTSELGKLYSLLALAETIAPLIFCPIYSKIYAETISTLPGAFYFTSIGLTAPALVIFGCMYCQSKLEHFKNLNNQFQPVPQKEWK